MLTPYLPHTWALTHVFILPCTLFTLLHSYLPHSCVFSIPTPSLMCPWFLMERCALIHYILEVGHRFMVRFCNTTYTLSFSLLSSLATLSLSKDNHCTSCGLVFVAQSTFWQDYNKEVLCFLRTFLLVGILSYSCN
jgi:hypothetical protein